MGRGTQSGKGPLSLVLKSRGYLTLAGQYFNAVFPLTWFLMCTNVALLVLALEVHPAPPLSAMEVHSGAFMMGAPLHGGQWPLEVHPFLPHQAIGQWAALNCSALCLQFKWLLKSTKGSQQ